MKKHAYHRAKYKTMNEWLSKVDWNDRLGGNKNSIDEMWNRFVNTIYEAVKRFVAVSKSKRRCGIWMTRKAMRVQINKMRMWERHKELRSYNDYTEYQESVKEID